MGYQLWTSPDTGHRRKGTRLIDLHVLLGGGIVTRTIYEPLSYYSPDAPALEVRATLLQRGFDVIGVRVDDVSPLQGYALEKELIAGPVRQHLHAIKPPELISESTPLAELLSVLGSRPWVLVLVGSDVTGIVTRADLNKPPLRIYLFGLISLLEMHLLYWIRHVHAEDTWQDDLNAHRLEEAKRLQEERKRKNEDIQLIDCLQFCDKRSLIICSEAMRNQLGLGSKSRAKRVLEDAEKLRNNLAHSQPDLVGGSSWTEQIKLVQTIEEIISRSDGLIEKSTIIRAPSTE